MSVQQWSAEETNALLAIWSTRESQDKLEGSVRKKHVYEEIAGEMTTAGFNRSADQVVNKLKNFKKNTGIKKERWAKAAADGAKWFILTSLTPFWDIGQQVNQPVR